MREGSDSVHTDDPMKDVTTEHQPAGPVEDQTPPPGYEPQVDLGPDQSDHMHERPADSVEDVQVEENDVSAQEVEKLGAASGNDDEAEDGEPG